MKKKITKITIGIILIFMAISFLLVKKISLKEPVFIKNCRDVEVQEYEGYNLSFDIMYITSRFNDDRIYKISFEELPDMEFFVQDSKANDKFSINEVRLVSLNTEKFSKSNDLNGKVLKNAKVEFTNGKVIDADLGEISLYKRNNNSKVSGISYKNSSDGYNAVEYKVIDNVKIEKIESPYLDEIKDVFDYKISSLGYDENTKVFEEQEEGALLKEPFITFSSNYICNDIMKEYIYYDIRPEMYLTNLNNDRYSFRVSGMSNRGYICYANKYKLYEYLKKLGEI